MKSPMDLAFWVLSMEMACDEFLTVCFDHGVLARKDVGDL